MDLTPWKPMLDERPLLERRLAALVRATLPRQEDAGSSEWKVGEHGPELAASEAGHAGGVSLAKIEWNMLERGICAGRRVGYWRFRGRANVEGHRVDFFGEFLRDEATGLLREFRLSQMGLPHGMDRK